jgi:hypothetical protein
MPRYSACLLLSFLTGFSDAPGSSDRWAWFRSTSVINNWFIRQGKADVTIEGRTFKATLWDSADTTVASLLLEGSITRSMVSVTVTVNESDVGPSHATGKLQRTCWKDGGGRESIILNEGFAVIGLVRELPRGAGCKAGA